MEKNHIFVDKIRSKISLLHEINIEKTDIFIKLVVKNYRKTIKFINGKQRMREFFVSNIECFGYNHSIIVKLIEDGDVNENWDRYLKCKNDISATLKANRRFTNKVTGSEMKAYLNDYITRQRFGIKKYELAI